MKKTAANKKITVNFALGYGGRDEIVRAIKKIPKAKIPGLDTKGFSAFLDTAGQPDPDLLVRTGGESRLSGFLLWQLEYTELYFTSAFWPDFSPAEFAKALKFYADRDRRFGK